jgi:hypothetical protein
MSGQVAGYASPRRHHGRIPRSAARSRVDSLVPARYDLVADADGSLCVSFWTRR